MNRTSMNRARRDQAYNAAIMQEVVAVFVLLISLGFPGNYTEIIGETAGKMLEYIAFILEIGNMLLFNASDWKDIQLIYIPKKYLSIYIYAFIIFGVSMVATSFPKEQFITCVRITVTTVYAIWLQDRYSTEYLEELICISLTAFIMFTLLLMVIRPDLVSESGSTFTDAFRGLHSTKNTCGTELAFGILMSILMIQHGMRRRRKLMRWCVLCLIQIVLLIMCQATGPVICLLISLFPIFTAKHFRLPLGLMYVTANIVFLFCALTILPLFSDFLEYIGKDATLTGRVPMWRKLIELMMQNKTMTGYGYGMFWRDPIAMANFHSGFSKTRDNFLATMTSGAHNAIIETWVNTGLIGVGSFFFLLLFAFSRVDEMTLEKYRLASTCMVFLMMNGLTERCLGGNYDYKMMILFISLSAGCDRIPVKSSYLAQKEALNRIEQRRIEQAPH